MEEYEKEYEKEIKRIKAIIIGITFPIIAIFILFILSITKVEAQSYYFSNPSLHRICSNTTIDNSSTNCETNNYQNWVGSPSGVKGNYLQVAYRMNTNNNDVSGTTYEPGNYSVSFQGVIQTIPGTDLSVNNIKLNLIYYPTSTNVYGKAVCDNDESFIVTKTSDPEGNFYYYSYKCETLTITEGKSFLGYELYISPTSLVKYIQWNQVATNLSLVGQGDATNGDIINNQNQNTQDIINNQNQNTDKITDAITGQGLSEDSKKPIDKEGINDYTDKEEAIINKNELDKINDIDIVIDTNSNTFIWDLITRILNTNALVFGMIITILSIGLIKLLLNR